MLKKIHYMLSDVNSDITLCGRFGLDVAFNTEKTNQVTCKSCLKAMKIQPLFYLGRMSKSLYKKELYNGRRTRNVRKNTRQKVSKD